MSATSPTSTTRSTPPPRRKGVSIRDLTERTAAEFHDDAAALLALPPTIEPRATEHVAAMIAMIERLIETGHAYEAEHHVLFAVASQADYGHLSGRSRVEMIAGARVEIAPYKRDPADFVLWKPSPEPLPGWDSPWGRGRPGWHIECSAMGAAHLGETFDIHGGGLDLIFPHHENEIAQSEAAHGGKPLARYWLHNGFVTVNGEKMAKSEGNFITIRDALDEAPGEAVRFALLTSHYRDPLDWTAERLTQARNTLDRFYLALSHGEDAAPAAPGERVRAALEDDLNTPLALTALHELLADLNKAEPNAKARLKGELVASGALLGLLQQPPEAWLRAMRARAARSRRSSPAATRRARRAISPRPIGFAPNSRSAASCSKTGRTAPLGAARADLYAFFVAFCGEICYKTRGYKSLQKSPYGSRVQEV